METQLRGCALVLLLMAGCGDSDEGLSSGVTEGISANVPVELRSDLLYHDDEVNDFHLTMAPADWDSIIADTMGDVYRRATLQWKDVIVSDIGVRPRGHSTRYPGNQKMSLKLNFNEFVQGRKFLGLKELKLDGLRESTQMRERIAYGVFRERIPASPRATHCKLFVNGAYRGVYMVEEPPTSDLVKHRFGGEVGNLYHIFVEHPEAYTFRGMAPATYTSRGWGPETHELDGDHTVIPRFLDVLNNRPAELATVCDVENLTDYLALEAALISYDGILRDAGPPQNHFTYWSPATGRFMFIPWDLDQSLTESQVTRDIFFNFDNTRIAAVVRDTPALRARYKQKIREITDTSTHPDRLNARIEFIYLQIREHVYADPNKLITNGQFDNLFIYLKNTVQARYDNLRAQLATP